MNGPGHYPFVICVVLALCALQFARTPQQRQACIALANATFLALILGMSSVLVLLVVCGLYLLLRRNPAPTRSTGIWTLCSCVSIGIFVVYKFATSHTIAAIEPVALAMSLIGFSFVVWRIIDLNSALRDGEPLVGPIDFFNYLLPFHMLAAGPICGYKDFRSHPIAPPGLDQFRSGLRRLAWGLLKKFVIVQSLEMVFPHPFLNQGPSLWFFLLDAHLYYIRIYLDFSAYSDIAVGVGRMTGIYTPENFNAPYRASNILDFWSRWHMSLTKMLRKHVFLPTQMQAMRSGLLSPFGAVAVAAFATFTLGGLWHGLRWEYLAWAMVQIAAIGIFTLYRTRWSTPKGLHWTILGWVITHEFNTLSFVLTGLTLRA